MSAKDQFCPPKEFPQRKVFLDPVYGYIYFDYLFLKQLVDTSVMQRMKRIKQLSCVYVVFSGAEHSRFNHSLGVYELARRFLEMNTYFFTKENIFSLRNKLLLLTAALLHDIGHGSYSHIFENILEDVINKKLNHEQQSARIIREYHEIASILDNLDDHFKDDVASIIEKKSNYKIIEQLITSQLDFDRLDYLVRDAFFTGVSYGLIDVDRLIRSIYISSQNPNLVTFKHNSVYAIENYLINRYHMHVQVYLHPKVRGYSVILTKIFKRIHFLLKKENNYVFICDHILQLFKDFIDQVENDRLSLETYIAIDDFYINSLVFYLQKEKDTVLVSLCRDFLDRKIWRCLKSNDSQIPIIKKNYRENEDYYTYQDQNAKISVYQEDLTNAEEQIFIWHPPQINKLSVESTFIKMFLRDFKNKEKKLKDKENYNFFYR